MGENGAFFDIYIDFIAVLFYNYCNSIMEVLMADIQSYERVLKRRAEGKWLLGKLLMIFLYFVIFSAWFVAAIRYGLHPAMILLAPLSVVVAVLLTWKYTCVEYEYSFMAGTLTFSKIYGKSRRRVVFEEDIKSMVSLFPYDDKAAARLSRDQAEKIIDAIPSKFSQNPCVCVFENSNDKKIYFLFDCDEQSAKIFKFFNSPATGKSIFDKLNTN